MKSLALACLPFLFVNHLVWAQADSLENALRSAQGESKVKTLNLLFGAYHQTDPLKAIAYTREALSLATEIEDRRGMAAAYNNLGVAYRNQGAFDKSLEYFITALKIFENLNYLPGLASTKANIGSLYSMKKDHGQALKFYEESFNLFTELKDEPNLMRSYNNLGNLQSELKLYDQALKYFTQSFELSQQLGIPFADPLSNIGNVYFQQGNFQRAGEFYNKALELQRAGNDQLGLVSTLSNLGLAYLNGGRPAQGQPYLEEALKVCTQMQSFSQLPPILKALSEVYYKQGKLQQAYGIRVQYDEAKDKIYGEESSRKVAQMQMVMSFQDKEKELEVLQKEDQIRDLQLKNSRFITIASLIGLLLMMALGYSVYLVRQPSK
jgi:tetratricopeptide (TPR) repeat protein